MLEKPDIEEQLLVSACRNQYGLIVAETAFLPLGADRYTAAYRIVADDGTLYFLKLRFRNFRAAAVTLTRYLYDDGITQIIPPLATQDGQLWVNGDTFSLILYPFVQGQDGYEVELPGHQWPEFGKALKKVHTARIPAELSNAIPVETYSPTWRQTLSSLLTHMDEYRPADAIAAELLAFLVAQRDIVLDLIARADHLARQLHSRAPAFVLCHADIHPGNLLIAPAGPFYIVDWDEALFAPKERDLMFIGTGHWREGQSALEEEALFYTGYGQTQIDPVAISYYLYERIIADIASFSDQIISTAEKQRDREQSLRYLRSNFLPGHTIDVAYRSEKRTRPG